MLTTISPSFIEEISQIIERNSSKTINLRQELNSKYSFENGFLRITNQFLNDLSFDFKTILQSLDRFKCSHINLTNNLQDNLNKNNELNLKIHNLKNQVFSLETSLLNANHQIQDLALLNKNHENYIEELVNKLNISKERPYSKQSCCLCDCPFCQNNYSFNSYKNKYCPIENSYEIDMNSSGRSTLIIDANKPNTNLNINSNINSNNNVNNIGNNLNNTGNNIKNISNDIKDIKANNNYINNPLSDSNYLYNTNINTNNSNQDNLNVQPNSIPISPVPFSDNYNSNIVSNYNRNNQEPIPNVNIPKLIPQNNYNDIQIKDPIQRKENFNNENNITPLNNIISSFSSENNDKGVNINQQSNDFLKSKNISNLKYNKIIPENDKEEEEKNLVQMKDKINKIEKLVQEALKDENIIKYLNIKLGDNFTEKLTQGDVTEEYLNQIENAIEDYNEDKIRNSKLRKNNIIDTKFIPKKKFKDPKENEEYNKMLLKKQIKDPIYHYKEFPRGWNSSKDYFTNNNSGGGKVEKNKIKIPNYPK